MLEVTVPASRTASLPAPQPPGDAQEAVLGRAEVRDMLAWMRLLIDPHDASAVVRALARPPIELRQVHLALVIQLARRRKLDLVAGVAAANESPQVPPEARERIQRFIELHTRAAEALETLGPEVFVASLIEIVCAHGRRLLAPEEAADQRASLEYLRQMAVAFSHRKPGSTPRELAAHLVASAARSSRSRRAGKAPSGAAEQTHPQAGAPSDDAARRGEPATGRRDAAAPAQLEPDTDALSATFQALRAEVLDGVARIGGRLGELRLDTELDVAHAVVRYLELLKLSALLQRRAGQELDDAIADINARLLAATTPLQREIFQTSNLDDTLASGAGAQSAGAAPREERSLGPFLPKKGIGLALSASDIQTYRSCPLRYKFSRVLRIPTEQTREQRFGIVVHQVLERFHGEREQGLEQMLDLLDAGWRRAGFGFGEDDSALYELARGSLCRYHARLEREDAQPVWFERPFAFRIGPHHLRGRVDRVDLLPGSGAVEQYELIDYKTSRPRSAEQLVEDVQLSLYALAAREAWNLESSRQSYYYVLDDRKVPLPDAGHDAAAISDLVLTVGEGILSEAFEPTPSPAACSVCGYRIVCPAAEAVEAPG
jgi:CRISPR/Cas system-associated exonuclease Cas4 (RecB family)